MGILAEDREIIMSELEELRKNLESKNQPVEHNENVQAENGNEETSPNDTNVSRWLENNGLSEFKDVFYDNGYHKLLSIIQLEDLINMGLSDPEKCRRILDKLKELNENIEKIMQEEEEEEPGKWKKYAGTAAVGIGTGLAAVALAPLLLSAAGFTAGGVAAGSVAAAAQSAFYGGATAGVFSALQSAGAAGIGLLGNAGIFVGGWFTGAAAKKAKDHLSGKR